MKKFKSFKNWIVEDFAQVGVAPEGTLGGTIGNPIPPTSTSIGSGDLWPSLDGVKNKKSSKLVCKKCHKTKKRCKCKRA
jgi:hypothetical protein